MGSIKHKHQHLLEETHTLTESEFNYLMNINQAKSNIAQEYNRVISAFLKYVSATRLGYPPEEDLQFELDFSDAAKQVKVTKLQLPKS